MKCPWWVRSATFWVGLGGIALCFIPISRRAIHQEHILIMQFQALLHIVLRFKTEARPEKLSEK
jgi:hypothetical protein